MQNKEIEEDNIFKISIPLITNAELNAIDNNLDDIVNLFTKQVIHDKDLLVAQHIIKRQKEYIDQLENKVKELEATKVMQEYRINEMDIPKQVIRDKIEELNKEYNEILNDYGNIDTDVTFDIPNENVRKHLDELVIKIITLQELLDTEK